jgi:hypothetical protein
LVQFSANAPKLNYPLFSNQEMHRIGALKIEKTAQGARRLLVRCLQTHARQRVAADRPRLNSPLAQKLLYWCRSICPRQNFPALQAIFGGRAGAGQLDWAAAESAEFVNQEIGYE